MATDWATIRAAMMAAIDACERIERLDVQPGERAATVPVGDGRVSAFDILTSAWTLPERTTAEIRRARLEAGAEAPFVPETARILVHVAGACAEFVGAAEVDPAGAACRRMTAWYEAHGTPLLERAIAARRGGYAPP